MKYKRVLVISSALLTVLVAFLLVGWDLVAGESDLINTSSNHDINGAVSEVLEAMPEIREELNRIRGLREKGIDSYISVHLPLTELFDPKKTEFRLAVENKLVQSDRSAQELSSIAQQFTQNYLRAIAIAEREYGVAVTQAEVTKYIDEHVAPHDLEEKVEYAQALGLTTDELDYVFDRDLYVMDTLWIKLFPVLMEKFPQQSDEDDNAFLDRIKREFYSK